MDNHILPDPEFQPMLWCPGRLGQICGRQMGPVRVYLATGTHSKAENRGKLAQTCTDYACLRTIFHTPAYKIEDATRLLYRKTYPGHPSGLPRDLRSPSPPPPPTATQAARNDCATPTCTTNSGIRTKGNANCIDKTCKACCIGTAGEARRRGIARGRCAPHGQPEIMALEPAAIGLPPTQLLPPTVTQTRNDTLIQDPSTISQGATPNTTKPTTPIQSLSRVHASVPGRASPVLNQQDVASQVPAPTQRPNIRSLAQPLAPGWGRLYEQANQEKLSTKNLKIQNHELDEQRKRTCTLVLYHTNGEPPLRLDIFIPTFPRFVMSSEKKLLRDLDISDDIYIDSWQGEWITVRINQDIPVEKGRRILVKVRPSARKALEDCPGIEDELLQQPKYRPIAGKKRAAEPLVSPPSKTPRLNVSKSIHSALKSSADDGFLAIGTQPSTQHPSQRRHLPDLSSQSSGTKDKQEVTSSLNISQAEADSEAQCSDKPKDWPHDFAVCILDKGFRKIESILSKNSTLKGKNKVLLKEAFSRAFPDAKWGKTTYYKYLPQWKSADEDIKDIFINLGLSPGAEFKVFLRALANPHHLPSPSPSPSPHSSPVPVEHSQLERKAKGKEKVTNSQDIPHNGNNLCEDDDDYTSTNDEDDARIAETPPRLCTSTTDGLYRQVTELQDFLNEILLDPESSKFFHMAKTSYSPGPSQHQHQTGQNLTSYYNYEQSEVILSALRRMFPEVALSDHGLQPLTWSSVINEFLFPETALLLIQEECQVSAMEAEELLGFKKSLRKAVKLESASPGTSRPSIYEFIDLTSSPIKQETEDQIQLSTEKAAADPIIIDLTLSDDD